MIHELARISDGTLLGKARDFASSPPDVSHKDMKWLARTIIDPAFDPKTQVRTGPADEIDVPGGTVTRTYTVRAKTAQELDDEKTAEAMNVQTRPDQKAIFELLWELYSGTAPAGLTKNQYAAHAKTILKDQF